MKTVMQQILSCLICQVDDLKGPVPPLVDTAGDLADPEQEHFTLHDGDMVSMVDGEVAQLEEDRVLTDGSTLLSDGTILWPNGERRELAEGDVLTLDGRILDPDESVDLRSAAGRSQA